MGSDVGLPAAPEGMITGAAESSSTFSGNQSLAPGQLSDRWGHVGPGIISSLPPPPNVIISISGDPPACKISTSNMTPHHADLDAENCAPQPRLKTIPIVFVSFPQQRY